MCRIVPLAMLLAVAMASCNRTPGEGAVSPFGEPNAPQEQILNELRQGITPLTSLMEPVPNVVGWGHEGAGAPANLTPEMREQVLAFVRSAKAKYENTDNGTVALNRLSEDLAAAEEKAWTQERWNAVMCSIDSYEILVPGSVKMARLRHRAEVRRNRPTVVVKGFFEDREKDDVYVFVEVTLHPGNEVKRMQIRKGDEFCGLRFVDFVGKLRGIDLEYLDVPGEMFRAMGP